METSRRAVKRKSQAGMCKNFNRKRKKEYQGQGLFFSFHGGLFLSANLKQLP